MSFRGVQRFQLNPNALMVRGGAIDGLAELAKAFVNAPIKRRQLELAERRSATQEALMQQKAGAHGITPQQASRITLDMANHARSHATTIDKMTGAKSTDHAEANQEFHRLKSSLPSDVQDMIGEYGEADSHAAAPFVDTPQDEIETRDNANLSWTEHLPGMDLADALMGRGGGAGQAGDDMPLPAAAQAGAPAAPARGLFQRAVPGMTMPKDAVAGASGGFMRGIPRGAVAAAPQPHPVDAMADGLSDSDRAAYQRILATGDERRIAAARERLSATARSSPAAGLQGP